MRAIVFALFGYLCGSVLFANVFGSIFGKKQLYQNSADKNPGTANAFKYGGFACGSLTLVCDLMKGFVPVFLFLRPVFDVGNWGLAAVLAAPVLGHIFPIFARFRGGKGVATTFGCLLGLHPYRLPFILFAGAFIFLSVGLRISPHYYRTAAAYLLTAVCCLVFRIALPVLAGFLCITAAVGLRLWRSKEEKQRFQVQIGWLHSR